MRFLVLMAALAFAGCDVAGHPARGRTVVAFQTGTPVADNSPVNFTVTVRDAEGHVVEDVPVTYAVDDPAVTITGGGDHTGKDGVVHGSLASTKTGEKTLSVTVGEGDITIHLAPEKITFVAGAPAGVHFIAQPSLVKAGLVMTPAVVVEVTDANGNRADNSVSAADLTLVRSSGGVVENGGTPQHMIAADKGLITFDSLVIKKPQVGYALRVQTTPDNGGPSDESAQFDVQLGDFAGSTSTLVGTPSDQMIDGGTPIALVLTANDTGGNPLEGYQASFAVSPAVNCYFDSNVSTTGAMGIAPAVYLRCTQLGAKTVTATIGAGSISSVVNFY